MPCLDQSQDSIDCGDPNCTFGDCTDQSTTSALAGYADLGTSVGTPTGPASPVAVAATGSGAGGPAYLTSLLNFGSSLTTAIAGPSNAGLRLQVNPATGLQQYYNPSTGQYVGGPITTASNLSLSSLTGSGSSILLVIVALVVAFFAFGGRKALRSA